MSASQRGVQGSSLLAGTPEYIAPEQAQGLKVDAAADLYSLGVMLFEMLAGQLPFTATGVMELMKKIQKAMSRGTKTGVVSGQRPNIKKAIVTLKAGESIDFFSNI